MFYNLYGKAKSVEVKKIVAVAQAVGARLSMINKPVDAKKSKVVTAFPSVPVLSTNRGVIHGSNAICFYLASAHVSEGLSGDSFASAQALGFLNNMSNELETALYRKTILEDDSAVAVMESFLAALELHLGRKTYCSEERKSFADVATAVVVQAAAELCSLGPNTSRWMNTVTADTRLHQKSGAKASSPKRAKKNPVKKEVEVSTVDTTPTAGKGFNMGHPSLNALDVKDFPTPPAAVVDSEFNLDDWKRYYSNSKDLYNDAMPYFFEHFDSNAYGAWKMVYDKYDGEGEKDYLTSNLLNGFIQRMDPSARKFGFGVCNVVGVDGDYNYEAVFIFKGTDMPLYMLDHPSFEYHKFARLDFTNEEHKQIAADMWCAEETINSRPIVDCKQFK